MKRFKAPFEGKLKIKKNDEVIVLSGKDKGKRGKVVEAVRESGKVRIEGICLVKKHQKPRATTNRGMVNQQLGEIEMPSAIDASKVMLICPKCSKETRIASDRTPAGTLGRKCRKCREWIDG